MSSVELHARSTMQIVLSAAYVHAYLDNGRAATYTTRSCSNRPVGGPLFCVHTAPQRLINVHQPERSILKHATRHCFFFFLIFHRRFGSFILSMI
jgi:hypothetical protein